MDINADDFLALITNLEKEYQRLHGTWPVQVFIDQQLYDHVSCAKISRWVIDPKLTMLFYARYNSICQYAHRRPLEILPIPDVTEAYEEWQCGMERGEYI